MGLRQRFHAWWWRTKQARGTEESTAARAQRLRTYYLEHLYEVPRSLDERVAYHLWHLSLYWVRCMGFLDVVRPPELLTSSLWLTVRLGTEFADADLRPWCAASGVTDVLDAWEEYLAALPAVLSDRPGAWTAVNEANARFGRVDELRRAHGLLAYYELHPLILPEARDEESGRL